DNNYMDKQMAKSKDGFIIVEIDRKTRLALMKDDDFDCDIEFVIDLNKEVFIYDDPENIKIAVKIETQILDKLLRKVWPYFFLDEKPNFDDIEFLSDEE